MAERDRSNILYVELPAHWQTRLKIIAAREGRTLRAIVHHALKPIIKSGKSGMDGKDWKR